MHTNFQISHTISMMKQVLSTGGNMLISNTKYANDMLLLINRFYSFN